MATVRNTARNPRRLMKVEYSYLSNMVPLRLVVAQALRTSFKNRSRGNFKNEANHRVRHRQRMRLRV